MRHKKKNRSTRPLAAFTISEMVIVALLSVITVSIGFTALDLIDRQFRDYGSDSQRLLVYSDLTRLLNRDFLLCDRVSARVGSTLDLQYDSMKVSYIQRPDYILRSSSTPGALTDTFYLEVTEFYPTFEEQLVQVGVVDRLRIETLVDGQSQLLLFQKDYAAADFYEFEQKK